MAEQNQNSIQQVFFSKDTISGLNKAILQDGSLQNLSREGKQEVINVLVKNMKTVYKNLDTSKINKTNFPSIFEQFKKITLTHTISDVKKQNLAGIHQQSPSDLKFQRDFTSNPNKGNQLMERPEPTKQMDPRTANQQIQNVEQRRNQQRQQMDQFSGFSADMGNYESSLDAAFRPIVDSLTDQDAFNSYDTGRNMDDVKSRMNSIQQARESEVIQRNARPPTPEFLKPKKTNVRSDSNDDSRNQNRLPTDQERRIGDRQNNGPVQVPDFKNVNPSQFNNGFNGLSNDTGDNLFSLDNIDRPLIEGDIIEDNSSFEDRLKRLQSDRDNYSQPNRGSQPQAIDFTSPNFPQSDMGDNSVRTNNSREQQMRDNEVQMQRHRQQQMRDNEVQMQRHQQMRDNEVQMQKQQQMRDNEVQMQKQQQMRDNEMQSQSQRQQSQSTNINKMDDLKSSMRSMNIDVKEDNGKINQYKQLVEKLEWENSKLKQNVEELENELKKNSDLDKINQLKQQIAHEFETLNVKNEELESKQTNINLKEIELNKKEIEVKQLVANYDYLFKSQHLQLEVTNQENKSSYVWSMDPIKNVIGIKLMSYSLPIPRFNIEQNKNGFFKYSLNSNNHTIVVPTGKYTIEELILVLNNNKEINENIKFSINNEQRIIFESTNEEDKIEITPTLLSKENLGFYFSSSEKNSHISDKIWDLRIENKVYLYLNNLSDEVPFGILYFNGQSVSQFKFKDPFDLNNLEIVFKDSNGMPYDFYGLSHSLSFLIEKIN